VIGTSTNILAEWFVGGLRCAGLFRLRPGINVCDWIDPLAFAAPTAADSKNLPLMGLLKVRHEDYVSEVVITPRSGNTRGANPARLGLQRSLMSTMLEIIRNDSHFPQPQLTSD